MAGKLLWAGGLGLLALLASLMGAPVWWAISDRLSPSYDLSLGEGLEASGAATPSEVAQPGPLELSLTGEGAGGGEEAVLPPPVPPPWPSPAAPLSPLPPGAPTANPIHFWARQGPGRGGAARQGPGYGGPRKSPATSLATARGIDVEERCKGVRPDLCEVFYRQALLPPPPPTPPSRKGCAPGCSRHGYCNEEAGVCMCPAGYNGTSCTDRSPRKCNNREIWSWSRCVGECSDAAMCFCPRDSLYPGRPLSGHCQPYAMPMDLFERYGLLPFKEKYPHPGKIYSDGGRLVEGQWPTGMQFNIGGKWPLDRLYGRSKAAPGWCNAVPGRRPPTRPPNCPCLYDGFAGPLCEVRTKMFCLNQCSGHGTCATGYCKCDAGYWGSDCSVRLGGGGLEWAGGGSLRPGVHLGGGERATRGLVRPRIYVYDMPPEFTSLLLQYRGKREYCVHRGFNAFNHTEFLAEYTYSIETALHEALLSSPHRTLNPDAADFFYVPVYSSCMIMPAFDYNNEQPLITWRTVHAMRLVHDAYLHIKQTYPYWDRRGGADHIWLFSHDEGACWAPKDILSSIFLTHWGRWDPRPSSSTAYGADKWDVDFRGVIRNPSGRLQSFADQGSRAMIGEHPCFRRDQDIVIPVFTVEAKYHATPFAGGGGVSGRRPNLLFFSGRMGLDFEEHYSRGVRQKVYRMFKSTPGFKLQEGMSHRYSHDLAESTFCLVPPGGDGWSSRGDDAIRHGCIPVIIQDHVDMTFESLLDYSGFAVRVAEAQVGSLDAILRRIANSPPDLKRRQAHMRAVWRRTTYANMLQDPRYGFRPALKLPPADDAVDSLMIALYAKLRDPVISTEGGGGGAGDGGSRPRRPNFQPLRTTRAPLRKSGTIHSGGEGGAGVGRRGRSFRPGPGLRPGLGARNRRRGMGPE